MDSETKGRLIALEALVAEVIGRLPHEERAALLAAVTPGLQRQAQDVAPYTTLLTAQIARRLPRS